MSQRQLDLDSGIDELSGLSFLSPIDESITAKISSGRLSSGVLSKCRDPLLIGRSASPIELGSHTSVMLLSTPVSAGGTPLCGNSPFTAGIGGTVDLCGIAVDETTSPSKMFPDDALNCMMSTFIDAMAEKGSSNGSSPLARDILSSEVFQDLRHTSTPKSSSPSLSISFGGEQQRAKKRIKFGESENQSSSQTTSRSWHVLHDITDQNVQSESFIKISDMSASLNRSNVQINRSKNVGRKLNRKKNCGDGARLKTNYDGDCTKEFEISGETVNQQHPTPIRMKVPILRGNSRRNSEREEEKAVYNASLEPKTLNGLSDFLYPSRNPSVRERDMWLYYTGFSDYDLMIKLISHLSVPSDCGLTSFQILMMTLMRIKCDLDWRDLSFRFRIFEPSVFSLYHSTVSLLAECLGEEVLPWWSSSQTRSIPGVFYAQPVVYRRESDSALRQIYIIVSSQCVVHITSPSSPQKKNPITLLQELEQHLITGDTVAIKGFSQKDIPTFFSVESSKYPSRLCYTYVESNLPANQDFLKSAYKVINFIKQYKLILSKLIISDDDMRKLITVVVSLSNISKKGSISDSRLKRIYKKSCSLFLVSL